MRDWTLMHPDDESFEEDYDARARKCDVLAEIWNEASRHLASRADAWLHEQEDRDWEEEDLETARTWKHLHDDANIATMAWAEEGLAELGARMMRPYEHWNEDEAYMRYMEEPR